MKTFVELLKHVETTYANSTAFNEKREDGWHSLSTQEFIAQLKMMALGLMQLGVVKGSCVGILAQPSPFWTMADLAIILCGGVTVPLFANISDENLVYQAKQTNLKVLFIDGKDQMGIFEKHHELFHAAISIDGSSREHAKLFDLQQLLQKGAALEKEQPDLYEQLLQAHHPDDLAAIIYTSGSTGVPKGVELTQKNLLCLVHFEGFVWDVQHDRYLSILPLAHVFGHCINLWMIAWGVSIYYFNDYKNLSAICREVHPTAIVVVPRILEKIYKKMLEQIHALKGFKRWIGGWAFSIASKKQLNFWNKALLPIADQLVYSKFREALGGKIRIVISGGAALNPRLQRFYDTIGVPIYEGWGLTEACPVCVNYPGKHKIGTVGPIVLQEQKIKISRESEILIAGPLVMRGYFLSPELTAQVIDGEGWLHTGDRGMIDDEGFLTISGRMKEMYKTSTGEYVAPVPIEQALTHHPLVDMALTVAEGRKFTSCLLFPNLELLQRLKVKHKADKLSDEAFLESLYVKGEMDKHLYEINKHLNHWEQLHGYRFILDPLSIENGELTASMKIRREVVLKKYQPLIDEIYKEKEE